MNAYLLTMSLISSAQADNPGTPRESINETANTDGESGNGDEFAGPETKEQTVDTKKEEPSSKKNVESGNQREDGTGTDGKTIETAIESESNAEIESEDAKNNDGNTSEIEQMMSEIMEEMTDTSESAIDLNLDIETDEESEEDFNYKGNIEYSYVLTKWDNPSRNIFHAGQFSGDPQYYFRQTDDWGYTFGGRFQFTGSDTLTQQYNHRLLGVTGGLQYTSFRINTSISWAWEQYFAQTQTDKTDGFVTYQYDELVRMSGVLWENTLTYSPDDMDFGVQASVGFPFQVNGERDMGQAFKDSWQVTTRLNISFFQIGYTHIIYPSHSIERIQIGSGILF